MIQNLNDVYKLIKSPAYKMNYKPVTGEKSEYLSYDLFSNTPVLEQIHIEIHKTYMEVYKYKNMNSEFYENVRTTNKRGNQTMTRFKELLFTKNLAAMVADIEENYR